MAYQYFQTEGSPGPSTTNIRLISVGTQPILKRWIHVVSTFWINVEITLIRRWEWNKIRSRNFNVAQHYATSVSDDEITLKQPWYNLISILFQHGLIVSKNYIETNRACDKYGFANRFLQCINNSAANKLINYYNNFLTVVHVVHNGKNVDAHRSSKFWHFKI